MAVQVHITTNLSGDIMGISRGLWKMPLFRRFWVLVTDDLHDYGSGLVGKTSSTDKLGIMRNI
jgi:hypothetical protein